MYSGPAPRGGGPVFRGGGPTFIERDVIIDRRPSGGGGGLFPFFAGTTLGLAVGSALSAPPPPPPPVIFMPEPIYVAPPTVVVNPPQRYQPMQPQVIPGPTIVVDQVNDGLTALKSVHWTTRRDGAVSLGKLGDARAVPALLDRLKHDLDRNVRQGSAWALGQIGDPRALPALEHAAALDRREEVRTVAAKAYHRIADNPPELTAEPEASPVDVTTRPGPSVAPRRRITSTPAEPVDDAELDQLPHPGRSPRWKGRPTGRDQPNRR